MKNMIKLIVPALMITQLTACSFARGPEFTNKDAMVSNGKSKIIVYRNYRFGDKCQYLDVQVDNSSVGTLKCSGFVAATVSPGTHIYNTAGSVNFTKKIKTTAGQVSYFQLTGNGLNAGTAAGTLLLAATGVGFSMTQYQFENVPEQTALSQLKGLKSAG